MIVSTAWLEWSVRRFYRLQMLKYWACGLKLRPKYTMRWARAKVEIFERSHGSQEHRFGDAPILASPRNEGC